MSGDEKVNASASSEAPGVSGASHEAGCGKPLVSTRFQKGRSGNPRGRPKKLKPQPVRFGDGHVARGFEKAALKTLKVNEGGKPVTMSVTEAIQHKMVAMALGGNRLLLQHLDKRAREEEARAEADAEEVYRFWRDYKIDQEARIVAADCKSPPPSLPHPADIVLDPAKRRIQFLGPISPEAVGPYAHCQSLCQLFAGLAERERRHRRTHTPPEPELCLYDLLATLLHRLLPPSYGGEDAYALVPIKLAWRSLGQSQLRNRIVDLQLRVQSWMPNPEGPSLVRHPQNERFFVALDRIADLMMAAIPLLESPTPIDDVTLLAVVRKAIACGSSGRGKGDRNRP